MLNSEERKNLFKDFLELNDYMIEFNGEYYIIRSGEDIIHYCELSDELEHYILGWYRGYNSQQKTIKELENQITRMLNESAN